MKLLTCVVPCYNSADYMRKAVDSLLVGGEEMDVLIVDDGSTDGTAAVADEYAAKWPGIVRVIHQPNGGHGSGLNQGIRTAEGIYFKVLDSDDRVTPDGLKKLLDLMRSHSAPEDQVDLVVHDYMYDRGETQNVFSVSYRWVMRGGKVQTWADCRHFIPSKQFMIHSIAYRVQLLRDHRYTLPEHTFYEDNLYIYQPLMWTKKVAYCNAYVHAYNIGRDDQSINEKNLLRRLDQLTSMITRMATTYRFSELQTLPKQQRDYMISNVAAQLLCVFSLQFIENTPESLSSNKKVWQTIESFDPQLCRRLKRTPACAVTLIPGRLGRRFVVFIYRLGHKIAHF